MEDLSFVPDLPSGPLDALRSTASFDWKRLKLALEGDVESLRLKYKVWQTLEKDPLFSHSSVTPLVEEQKRITQLQLMKINQYKFLTDDMLRSSYANKSHAMMTLNQAVQALNPSLSVKIGIGIYSFSNALLSLGTERHRKFYEDNLVKRKMLASFALTEVAHGSDARFTRTTATYDAAAREFVVHTPDFQAAKCWVGNLGRTCTYSLVFAQLITPDGTNHGLHGFVVPIRDPGNLETYPGIVVGDLGEKIGVNGIDNGFMMFNQYRIPRENLLNRTADVTVDGVYVSSFSEPSKMLAAALENFLFGRIAIMQESCQSISSAVCIAVRYAATRRQFGTAAQEIPLIEYPLHQWRLFGFVAAAVVFKLYIQNLTRVYLQTIEDSHTKQDVGNLREIVSEIHAIVSSSKPMVTWTVLHACQYCREACGGHGFMKRANLGDIRNNHDATVTYEGDNSVLSQQAGNWLLKQYEKARMGEEFDSPLGTVDFLKEFQKISANRFSCKETSELKSVEFVLLTYRWLLCWVLKDTNEKFESLLATGLTTFEAKAKCQVYKWQTLTEVYAEYLALILSLESIEQKEKALQPVLNKFFLLLVNNRRALYGLWSIEKHLVELYQGFAEGELLAKLVREAFLELCEDVKDEAVGVVDALGPTDFVLNSVLGNSDGKLYQNLQKEFFHNPGAMGRATWWREVVDTVSSKL